MENVNNSFFDGHYKEIWRSIIPAELTVKEVDFILSYFKLSPGNKVLDLMCGYGRHSLGLARKGYSVTAVDNLDDYIDEIRKIATNENLPVKAVKADVINYEANETFDLALCMGNSLCFFNRADTMRLLNMIASHLVKGGHFFINTWMLAEIAFNGFREKTWSNMGEMKLIYESKFFLQPTRIETDQLILFGDGSQELKKAVDYIYSIAETEAMLAESGFQMKEVFSIPGKKKFTLGDPRAYIVAEKI